MTDAALRQRYPHLFDVAWDVVDHCAAKANRSRALWWTGKAWKHAPVDGRKFGDISNTWRVAGIYTASASVRDIVADMLTVCAEARAAA